MALENERGIPVPNRPQCADRQRHATMRSENLHRLTHKGISMAILTVDIDLAKNVIAWQGVNEAGKADPAAPTP